MKQLTEHGRGPDPPVEVNARVVDPDPAVEHRHARERLRMLNRPLKRPRSEVMHDQVRTTDVELPQHPVEVARVALRGVVEISRLISIREAGHVDRDTARKAPRPAHEI
jgi:hypothetical protein